MAGDWMILNIFKYDASSEKFIPQGFANFKKLTFKQEPLKSGGNTEIVAQLAVFQSGR